jgi:hypothetical protein
MHRIVLTCALCLLSLGAWAQNLPQPPANALNYFLKALRTEAGLNVSGTVSERQLFPPRKDADAVRKDFPAPPPLGVALLRRNWTAQASIGEPIAGRDTWRVDLTPNNRNAPSFTYWFDREWNVRLGVDERDPYGTLTYSARYSTITKPAKRGTARQLTLLEPKPKLEEFVRAQIGAYALPEGFRLMDIRPRTVRDDRPAVDLRASNGLSVLVIVFSPVSTGRTPKLAVRDLKGSWVWVVGNLVTADLDAVAQSIRAPLEIGALLNGFNDVPR